MKEASLATGKVVQIAGPETVASIQKALVVRYRQFPTDLREHARTEMTISSGEQARYVLELIQNADDAQVPELGAEIIQRRGEPRLVFRVTNDTVYCANGGYPLSHDGLLAISHMCLSPKITTRTIGYKGIGFKSVLGFASQVDVFWPGGAVTYSREKTFRLLQSEIPELVEDCSTLDVPLLRCPFQVDLNQALADDQVLQELFVKNATAFRFKLRTQTSAEQVWARLEEITPSILLFLSHLTSVEIDGRGIGKPLRIYTISRLQKNSNISQVEVEQDGVKSLWTLYSEVFDLDDEVKSKVEPDWRDVTSAQIVFGFPTDPVSNRLMPVGGQNDPYPTLHVFFPTEEKMPIRVLTHGTFRTNADRRLLVEADAFNEFVAKRMVSSFVKHVLAMVIKNASDPAAILDFLSPPDPSDLRGFAKAFWTELRRTLNAYPCLPSSNGGWIPPNRAVLAPQSLSDQGFKQILEAPSQEKEFCSDGVDTQSHRRRAAKLLGAEEFDPLAFFDILLPKLATSSSSTLANVYQITKKLDSLLSSTPLHAPFREKARQTAVLRLSDGSFTSSSSATVEGPIFFPPERKDFVALVPAGIRLRFIDSDTKLAYQAEIKGPLRGSYLNQVLGVEEFSVAPILSKAVIPAIREFWNNKQTFIPTQLVEFVFQLFREEFAKGAEPELPGELKRALGLIPLTTKNGDYAPAASLYASKDWTGTDDLERIYGFHQSTHFLESPDSSWSDEDLLERTRFLQWLGVEWLPRVQPQFGAEEEERWQKCIWERWGRKCLTSPHSALANWSDYCEFVSTESRKFPFDPVGKPKCYLRTSFTLDRFVEVVQDHDRAKVLYTLLERSWPRYAQYTECELWYVNQGGGPYYTAKVLSYFGWSMKTFSWMTSTQGLLPPTRVFQKSPELHRTFSDLLPYMTSEPQDASFAGYLGIRRSVDELVSGEWWSIALGLPDTVNATNERFIKALYRRMLQVLNEDDNPPERQKFLQGGKVLSYSNGERQFFPRKDVWYGDDPELLEIFSTLLPFFAIMHEERRGARVSKIFGIPRLSEHVESFPSVGEEDSALTDSVHTRFRQSTPLVLARLQAERPKGEEEDLSRLRRLRIVVVKSLSVKYVLESGGLPAPVAISVEKKPTLLRDEGNGRYSLLVNAEVIQIGQETDAQWSNDLAAHVARQLAFYLDANLPSEFRAIFAAGTYGDARRELVLSNVTESDIVYCEQLLSNEPVQLDLVVRPLPPTLQLIPMISVTSQPRSPEFVAEEAQPLDIWRLEELGFGQSTTLTENGAKRGEDGVGGGGGGGSSNRRRSQEERDTIDNAGMALVLAYEREIEGRVANDVSKNNVGYDIESVGSDGVRMIEVKSSGGDLRTIEMTLNEWETARNPLNRSRYYLYRVRHLDKSHERTPSIMRILDPYGRLSAEPTSFRVHISTFKDHIEVVSLMERKSNK